MALPWMKWFGAKWRSDPQLSACNPATRGIWADLISAMQEQGVGQLVGTIESLARVGRCTSAEMVDALADLKKNGAAEVGDISGTFTILSRRLSREFDKRKYEREKKKRQRSKNVPDSAPDCTGVEVRSKKIEERKEKKETAPKAPFFDFESLYWRYPKREGGAAGMKTLRRDIRTLEQFERFSRAVDAYAAKIKREGTERKYILLWSTFANSRWTDYAEPEAERSPPAGEAGMSLQERARIREQERLNAVADVPDARLEQPGLFPHLAGGKPA